MDYCAEANLEHEHDCQGVVLLLLGHERITGVDRVAEQT